MRPGREKKRRRRILVVATGSPRQMRLVQRGTARQMIAAGMDHHQISDHLTTRRRENPFYSGDGRFDSRNIHYVRNSLANRSLKQATSTGVASCTRLGFTIKRKNRR